MLCQHARTGIQASFGRVLLGLEVEVAQFHRLRVDFCDLEVGIVQNLFQNFADLFQICIFLVVNYQPELIDGSLVDRNRFGIFGNAFDVNIVDRCVLDKHD